MDEVYVADRIFPSCVHTAMRHNAVTKYIDIEPSVAGEFMGNGTLFFGNSSKPTCPIFNPSNKIFARGEIAEKVGAFFSVYGVAVGKVRYPGQNDRSFKKPKFLLFHH